MDITWDNPYALLLILLPVLFFSFTWLQNKRQWQNKADKRLIPWLKVDGGETKQVLKQTLFFIIWSLFCIALAAPRTPQFIPPNSQKINTSIMVVLDYSASMMVLEGNLTRQKKSQQLIKKWLKSKPNNVAMGLVVFAGHAHKIVNATLDKDLLKHFVKTLSQLRLPTLGNNLSSAIKIAKLSFNKETKQKIIIVLSDGDLGKTTIEKLHQQFTKQAKKETDFIFIGIGLDELSSLNINNQKVLSRLNSKTLKNFAHLSKGQYFPLNKAKTLNLKTLIKLEKTSFSAKQKENIIWQEWFFIPLLLGILLLLFLTKPKPQVSLLVLASLLINVETADAQSIYLSAFYQGQTCYQSQDYQCAQKKFALAAWQAKTTKSKAPAVFNLANTHYKLADYEQAVVLYEEAQKLGIAKEKATINLAFAKSLAQAVQQRQKELAKTLKRAKWRAQANNLDDVLLEQLAESRFLASSKENPNYLPFENQKQFNTLILKGLKTLNSKNKQSRYWVSSPQTQNKQGTAKILNQLFAENVGLAKPPQNPKIIKGLQPW